MMPEWLLIALLAVGEVWACRNIFSDVSEKENRRPQSQPRTEARPQPSPAPRASQHETETGPMVYFANDRHGRGDREYRFNYKKVNGSWRAYILKMPSLGGRDSSGTVTHRLYDGNRPYVCWDSTVRSLKDMQAISRVWADHIQEYIATGKRFG